RCIQDLLDQRLSCRTAEAALYELRHGELIQPWETERTCDRLPSQSPQAQPNRFGCLSFAVARQDCEPEGAAFVDLLARRDQMEDQVDRARVGPVDVVEHDDEGPAP